MASENTREAIINGVAKGLMAVAEESGDIMRIMECPAIHTGLVTSKEVGGENLGIVIAVVLIEESRFEELSDKMGEVIREVHHKLGKPEVKSDEIHNSIRIDRDKDKH